MDRTVVQILVGSRLWAIYDVYAAVALGIYRRDRGLKRPESIPDKVPLSGWVPLSHHSLRGRYTVVADRGIYLQVIAANMVRDSQVGGVSSRVGHQFRDTDLVSSRNMRCKS